MPDLFLLPAGEEMGLAPPMEAAEAAAVLFGGSYPLLAQKKKKLEFLDSPWQQYRALSLERVHQAQERERQTHIAAVRDMNLQKAQFALQEKRQREERIGRERLKNLEKARKARRQ